MQTLPNLKKRSEKKKKHIDLECHLQLPSVVLFLASFFSQGELFYWVASRHVPFIYRRLWMCRETRSSPSRCSLGAGGDSAGGFPSVTVLATQIFLRSRKPFDFIGSKRFHFQTPKVFQCHGFIRRVF